VLGYWHGYVSGSRCRFAYGPADATATPYLLLQKIEIGFTFLVSPYKGKGDPMECGSYRGIKLLKHAMKVVVSSDTKFGSTLI